MTRIALVLGGGELPGHVAERDDLDAVDLDETDPMQIVVEEDESLARLFELLAVRFVLGYPSRGGLFRARQDPVVQPTAHVTRRA